jgi:Fe-S oxidoreductase
VTLHDPCFYGRYLELSDVPARVLHNLGFESVTVRNSGQFTHCCGGPAESISPRLTDEVLGRRVEELKGTGAPIVAMCPICLGNLLRAGVQAEDLSSLVARSS